MVRLIIFYRDLLVIVTLRMMARVGMRFMILALLKNWSLSWNERWKPD